MSHRVARWGIRIALRIALGSRWTLACLVAGSAPKTAGNVLRLSEVKS
jgi:hypothetical protein